MEQETGRRTVYLASPLGFAESTWAYMERVVERLEGLGLRVLNPWTLPENREAAAAMAAAAAVEEAQRRAELREAARRIGATNERALRESDLVVAVLDGVDVDSGTAAEIGFAAALGRTVFGLRSDFRRSGEVEGLAVNLQVQWWIEESGGAVTTSLDTLETALRGALGTALQD